MHRSSYFISDITRFSSIYILNNNNQGGGNLRTLWGDDITAVCVLSVLWSGLVRRSLRNLWRVASRSVPVMTMGGIRLLETRPTVPASGPRVSRKMSTVDPLVSSGLTSSWSPWVAKAAKKPVWWWFVVVRHPHEFHHPIWDNASNSLVIPPNVSSYNVLWATSWKW